MRINATQTWAIAAMFSSRFTLLSLPSVRWWFECGYGTTLLSREGDSEEDSARLKALCECLALFEGRHAFHNYTKRRLYR